ELGPGDEPSLSRLFGRAPVRELKLHGDAELAPLMRCPHPERLARIALESAEGDEADLMWLAGARRFTGPRELTIAGCDADDALAARLASSPYLGALEALDLSDNQLSEDGCRELIESPRRAGLRTLLLNLSELCDADVANLLRLPGLARLTGFGISG